MRAVLFSLVVISLVVAHARLAHACTNVESYYASYPEDRETDVPLDAVPWFMGFVVSPDAIRLEDDTGVSVTIDVVLRQANQGLGGAYEIRPAAPLSAMTRYTVLLAADLSFSFTTGDRVAAAPGSVPNLGAMQRVEAPTAPDLACGLESQFCVAASADEMYELRYESETGESRVWLGRGPITALRGDVPFGAFCLSLHARAENGALSAPATACSDGALTFAGNDPLGGYDCRDGRLIYDGDYLDETRTPVSGGSGCAVSSPRQAPSPLVVIASALATLAFARPRRRSHRAS
jgi:hypothetical protein